MTDLDLKIKEMAQTDWETLMQLMGSGALITVKARLLRKNGKSYKQISVKLEITEAQARYACNKKDDKN